MSNQSQLTKEQKTSCFLYVTYVEPKCFWFSRDKFKNNNSISIYQPKSLFFSFAVAMLDLVHHRMSVMLHAHTASSICDIVVLGFYTLDIFQDIFILLNILEK